ncbi:MAG: hypothetical protein WBA38_10600 [Gordonia sp. (in: high G+C Gram-positive bacteria)]|uniref:hypothetical protein n=1 Tax=Gordonia sp. (in: high G+C Gram-positive bacteria) TaxID=84139 RepID=UPI003C738F3E
MAAVAALGSLALVATAGIVMWGAPTALDGADANGVLKSYSAEPAEAWTLDDAVLPNANGEGAVRVAASSDDDWLISYTAGIKHRYQLVDARTGNPQWDQPIDAGFGACAVNDARQIGCAVRTGLDSRDNGFYLVDRDSGEATRTADGDDTSSLLGFGNKFVHVNQTGYQVSLRDAAGHTAWSRTFAGAAKVRAQHGLLIVDTSDDAHFVVDPTDGSDQVSCSQCSIDVFDGGLAVTSSTYAHESVSFYPVTSGKVSAEPAGIAQGMGVVRGPSTFPVIAPAGPDSLLATGHYEVVDPATGDALWQLGDPEVSKANARPCGPILSVARKDRSRVFFDLADGTRRGSMAPPALDQPDANLDAANCVGASTQTAVFANPNQITAIDINSGQQAWTRSVLGAVEDVDGYLTLRQGSTLTALEPN